MDYKLHKLFIGIGGILVLIVGLLFGVFLSANVGFISLEIINFALLLAVIILLLMIGSVILKINDSIEKKKK